MKNLLFFLLALFLLFVSCSDKEPTAHEESTPAEVLAEKTIGPDGGALETEDFKLNIPAGAFSTSAKLKLHTDAGEKPFGENGISNLFRIEGLPSDIQKPISIALKYQGSLSNKCFIAMGEDVFVKSLGITNTSYCLLSASDSSGYLITNLPATNTQKAGNGAFNKKDGIERIVRALGLTNLIAYDTPEGHFGIIGRSEYSTQTQLEDVGNKFEIAYSLYKYYGFNYDEREYWPIQVILKKNPMLVNGKPAAAYYSSAEFLEGHGYIVIDTDILLYPSLYETIGHEFLHLIQALYDPRDWNSKIFEMGNHLWLDEATATYSEELFNDNPSTYISSNFQQNAKAPFSGIHKEGSEAITHGYGTASLIKYLVNHYSTAKLVNFYNEIKLGKHPIEAIINNSEKPKEWLEPFYRDYILGNIYNRKIDYWMNNADKNIQLSKDNLPNTIKESFQDLSAKIYKIEINHSEFKDNERIGFSIDGDEYSQITLFKYNNSEIDFIDKSFNLVTSPQVSDLKNGQFNLMALVTNNSAEDPYTENKDITLTIGVSNIPQNCLFVFSAECKMKYAMGTIIDHYNENRWVELKSPGIFNNNLFTANWDSIKVDDLSRQYHDVGHIKIQFDASLQNISSIEVKESSIALNGEYSFITELSAQNIPILPAENLSFQFQGEALCNHINYFNWEMINTSPGYDPVTETVEEIICAGDDDGSQNWIMLVFK